MKIKNRIMVLVFIIAIFMFPLQSLAIGVEVNGVELELDQPPVMESGRTLVPLRVIFEELGADVEWNGETQTVVGTMEEIIISLQVGNENASVNGNTVTMDVPAMTVQGRTLVPARFVAESLGASVDWNNETQTVIITTENAQSQPVQEPSSRSELEVHFIDVGQGDSILVISPNKGIMLVDAGTSSAGEKIVSYLKKAGITTIDKFVATHPHADHIGGAQHVFDNFEVKKVYDSGLPYTTQTYENFLTAIDEKNIAFEIAHRGNKIDLDNNLVIDILHPGANMEDANNNSIVLKVTYGNVSFMLTGDAEHEAETVIVNYHADLKSQILKVGHHGSSTSTTQEFLNAVNPEVAVIQVGEGNRYGHPTEEVLNRLANAGIDIYRNDLQGDIVIKTDGNSYSINAQPFEYTVPEESESIPQPTPEPSSGRININTASLEELQEIVHIGPDRAQEIIRLRPFSSIEGLSSISGIGPARIRDIKEEGKAYVD